MALENSKAKWIKDLLDRALSLKAPRLSSAEFERAFNITLTDGEIADISLGELMIRQLVVKAAAGNDRSINDVLDRLLGKPMQTTEAVTKSYNYHDFLLQLKNADAVERGENIVNIPAPADQAGPPKRGVRKLPPPKPAIDIFADLLGEPEDIFA